MTWSMSLIKAQRIKLYRVGLTLHWLKHPGDKHPHLMAAQSNTLSLPWSSRHRQVGPEGLRMGKQVVPQSSVMGECWWGKDAILHSLSTPAAGRESEPNPHQLQHSGEQAFLFISATECDRPCVHRHEWIITEGMEGAELVPRDLPCLGCNGGD